MNSKKNVNVQSGLLDELYRTPVQRHVFENGLTLVSRPDFSSEVVSVQLWVKTGSIHEGGLLGSGLSHYLEHLLFKGTSRRDGKSISREVHAFGGAINAYTTFDRTVYYIDGPAEAFVEILDVLADIVFDSLLPDVEVQRERDVILREIDMGLDDPDRRLMQGVFRTAYQKHPYREPVIGHRGLFEQVTREELWDYYKSRYVPNNAVLSVVGAISDEACYAAVDERFSQYLRCRLGAAPVNAEPEQLAARRFDLTGDFNVFRGAVAFKVPHLSHEDSPKLDALAHALGGGESALLWQRLRNEQKLVQYIDCRNWSPGDRGLLWLSYVCDPAMAERVESAITEVFEGVIQDGLDQSVLEKACRQALSSEINGRKTMSGQASRLGMGEVVLGDLNYGRRYLQRLGEVTCGDIQDVASRYLIEPNRSTVTLAPKPAAGLIAGTPLARKLTAFDRLELPNGVRVLLQPDDSLPKVHLRCVMLGGPLYEPAGQRGVSAIMAELLTKDAGALSGVQVSERIESVGGQISASVGNNTINLSVEVLPVDLELGVDLLRSALSSPRFEADTFETEVSAQISHIEESDDEILDYAFRRIREVFFGAHPFSVGPDGRVADLQNLTRDMVKDHYEAVVRPENLVIAVSGDFERGSMIDLLSSLAESISSKKAFVEAKEPRIRSLGAKQLSEQLPREQSVVLQAYGDAGLKDDDYVTGEMLNELFSGMSSRLFERVRDEKGMAYYVGSSRIVGLSQGMFVMYAGTHPDQVGEVLQEMDAELARVRAGEVSLEELNRCRTRLRAARVMGRQTIGSRAVHAALQEIYGLPLDDEEEYRRKLDSVDAKSLAQFVETKIRPAQKIEFCVGP